MKAPLLALTAVVATSLIGASAAAAAPTVDSVEVARVSAKRVVVSIDTVRGSSTVEPRVMVRIGRRAARLHTIDWEAASAADDLVLSVGRVRARTAVGDTVTVRIRVCDIDCVVTQQTVVVVADDTADDAKDDHGKDYAPLPAGAVTADQAATIAIAANTGSTLLRTERTGAPGAVWEVKLRGADGSTIEVLIAADGTIVRQKTESADDDHDAAPLPAGAVTAEQASALALLAVPGVVREVERTDDAGAVWKVKIAAADGTRNRVYVAADGTIVRTVTDR